MIWRADDSSGIIGDAIQEPLDLHAELVRAARPPATKIVDWMIHFQFGQEVDYFTIDPVAYAPALGEKGLAQYREKLVEIARQHLLELTNEQEAILRGEVVTPLDWDVGSTIPASGPRWSGTRVGSRSGTGTCRRSSPPTRDRKVAAWLKDTAEALAEIGELDLAIDWARQGAEFGPGYQSVEAAAYWCYLLAEHRPQDELPARLEVFHRWPTAVHAAAVHKAAGDAWLDHRDAVMAGLQQQPREAVAFALHTLKDVRLAWTQPWCGQRATQYQLHGSPGRSVFAYDGML